MSCICIDNGFGLKLSLLLIILVRGFLREGDIDLLSSYEISTSSYFCLRIVNIRLYDYIFLCLYSYCYCHMVDECWVFLWICDNSFPPIKIVVDDFFD